MNKFIVRYFKAYIIFDGIIGGEYISRTPPVRLRLVLDFITLCRTKMKGSINL